MKKVLIPTKLQPVAKEMLEAKGLSVIHDSATPLEKLIAEHPDTEALIVRSNKITAAIIEALPELKLIVRAGSGYNTIDTKEARRNGVDVMNTPGANANAVAEEVIALMLAYCRNVVPADESVRSGKWEKKKFMGRELANKTVGVVGLGNIGQLVVKRLQGFDCEILGYDPIISQGRARDLGVTCTSLEGVFEKADFVTLHIPETDKTRGMVDKKLLGIMKDGAVLVNCARAGVLVEEDLREIKKSKNIGFCNDVYAKDAEGKKSVADIADVMLPHLGASTIEANTNAARRAAEQLIAYAERGITKFVVNKGVPEGLDEIYQQLAYEVAFLARCYLGKEKPIRHIECSFYGELENFAKWFLSPIVAGISADFDVFNDPQEAEEYLKEKGTSYDVREVDDSKGYGNSMTIDLLEGKELIRSVSMRGTVAEGKVMISRINNFDNLYFQPRGHSLLVCYVDRPGVLAKITRLVAEAGVNIEDIRAPQDPSAAKSLAVLQIDRGVPATTVEEIRQQTEAETAVCVSMD
ncbi:MAG: NAD(P)-dependent oxidoreductase [Lentisphaeria bacterium]